MRACHALTIVALLHAANTDAGVIRGRVEAPAQESHRSGRTQVIVGGVMETVVWVDSLPPKAMRRYRPNRATARITQSGRSFLPRVTAVAAGSPIHFANRDEVYHNVFSVSPAKRFDLGKYPPRAINRVTFDRPGVVNLYCDIHPGMAAWVVVVPHRVFARPTASGAFQLPDLPPGHYVLRAWHPNHGHTSGHVEVPQRGDVIANLRF